MTPSLNPTPEVEVQLNDILLRAVELVGGISAWMELYDRRKEGFRCISTCQTRKTARGTITSSKNAPSWQVLESGAPVISEDYSSREKQVEPFLTEAKGCSVISVPMVRQERVEGVMHIVREGTFDESVAEDLLLFAQQAAIILENEQLLINARERASQSALLNNLSHAALRATDLSELLEVVSARMGGIIEADRCQIALWDEERSREIPGLKNREVEQRIGTIRSLNSPLTLTQSVLDAGFALAIEDVRHSPYISPEVAAVMPAVSMLGLPLIVGDEKIGAALLGFSENHSFTQDEISIAEQAAAQVALAIAQMRAMEDLKQRGLELESLREASLAITSSLELQEVLETIAAKTLELVKADDTHIFLYDGERLEFGAAQWSKEEQHEPFYKPREDGLTHQVAKTGKTIVVSDVNEDLLYEGWRWGGAIVGLPLTIGDRVVGVMNVALDAPHHFENTELRVLGLLADQAAIVIENARLFEDVIKEQNFVQLLYEIAQELSHTLDRGLILQYALTLTMEILTAWSGEFFAVDKESGEIRVEASVRVDGLSIPALHDKATLQVGKGLIGWVAEHREAVLLRDVREDARWMTIAGVDEEVFSAICCPVLSESVMQGVMGFFHQKPDAFTQDHMHLLKAISHQVSLALNNAQSYQELERRLAEMSVVRQVVQVVNQRVEMQPLLDEVVHQVGKVLGFPVVEVYLVEGDSLFLRAARGGPMDTSARYSLSDGLLGRAVMSGEPVYAPDVTGERDYICAWPDTKSEIAVPLRKEDVVIGVLNVESPIKGGLTEDDLRLLTLLADQLSIAVENAALYGRLRSHADDLQLQVAERTAKLAEALERAREAEKLKTQFVSDVSHELRTPLSNIRLYLDLLKRGNTERYESYLGTLSRETDRLVALIEDLLAISRLDVGSASPEPRLMDLNALAKALVDDRKQLFSDRQLSLTLDLQEGVVEVPADERMISQVVANLMTNAMHYTPKGGRVRLSTCIEKNEGREWATLTISDTGMGIPPDESDRIFERFYRGSASRRVKAPGTGLGLAICKEILDRHNGKITFESRINEGTNFKIWLPTSIPEGTGMPQTPGM